VAAFETLIGRPLAIDLHYYDWTDDFPSGLEESDIAHGRIPVITWRGSSLDAINAGFYDPLIRARAAAVKQLGAPVFLRWGWEMNGNWYAHAGPLNMPNAQPLEADLKGAGERGAPALVEDRLVQRFDGAVGLRSAGTDPGRARAEPLERLLETAAKLAAVVGERPLEPPAGHLLDRRWHRDLLSEVHPTRVRLAFR